MIDNHSRPQELHFLEDMHTTPHTELTANLEHLLEMARPRLLRLARMQGVTLDAADDVVQETLIEAWRHLDHLRAPDRFEAWLGGICRNVCRRWARVHDEHHQRQMPFPSLEQSSDLAQLDLPDQTILDPGEELSRQDLIVLLDRALGHLSKENRRLIELFYLAEIPGREIALRFHITIDAFESRLRRARHQLQQVLTNELSAEAEACGLMLGHNTLAGWRESREWCISCGRQRLYGLFEPQPDGRTLFRVRCPNCSPPGQDEIVTAEGIPPGSFRSFRPAFKRVMQDFHDFVVSYHEGWGRCPRCGIRKPAHLIPSGKDDTLLQLDPLSDVLSPQPLLLVLHCDICMITFTQNACVHVFIHPIVQHFRQQHPRAIVSPQTFTTYAGLPAIRLSFTDVASAARINAFVHRETLHVLAVLQG